MIVATLVALASTLAPAYAGQTDDGTRLTLSARDHRIVRVTTTVARYTCDRFGDIGPLRVTATARVRPDERGRFAFVAGERAERIGVAGRVRGGHTITGRVRVSGSIGTGERCRPPLVRFRVHAGR